MRPKDRNLETGVVGIICGEHDRLCPPPDQLNVDIFLPSVDAADVRL